MKGKLNREFVKQSLQVGDLQ